MRTAVQITVPAADAVAPNIDQSTRAVISGIAETLMPDKGLLPSVHQAETTGRYLDDALIARPDLVEAFLAAVGRCSLETLGEDLATLQRENGKDWEVLTTILPAAYLMNAEVRQALGYKGQGPQPIQDAAPEEFTLTEPVSARGPIYRPTPGQPLRP
jgi:hypothetical protein